jgi:hypothetical protein
VIANYDPIIRRVDLDNARGAELTILFQECVDSDLLSEAEDTLNILSLDVDSGHGKGNWWRTSADWSIGWFGVLVHLIFGVLRVF